MTDNIMETTMALLRHCLQELRTKHRDWDAPSGLWPEAKPLLASHSARTPLLQLPRPLSGRSIASQPRAGA